MHPAAHRAVREIVALSRQLENRWTRLADRLPDAAEPLQRGARDASALVDALSALAASREIPVGGAATGLGTTLGEGRALVAEPFLERNQALRLAVLDIHHVTVGLHYLQRLADAESDGELAAACADWARRLVEAEGAVRDAAIAEGDAPDRAIEPVDDSAVGRAAHGVAAGLGAAGEWVDGRFSR